jgi:hypothetical protein
MIGSLPPPPPPSPSPLPDLDRWGAQMLLAVQAFQRLNAALDGKFVHSKSNP